METFNISIKNPSHVIIEIFGGDNNLSNYIDEDLGEFAAGNQGNFSMLCLCDYYGKEAVVLEYHPQIGFKIIEKLGEIDTGNPHILKEFIARALKTYSSCPKVALGFWDHGSGVFNELDPEEQSLEKRLRVTPRKRKGKSRNARRLFLSNVALKEKAMLNDDTNGGVLTNYEAHQVVKYAIKESGFNRKLNMIFSDTCLNGMIEVLCQFKDVCDTVVGSEDLEPGDGWDYFEFLHLMTNNPPNTSKEWAYQAVEAFKLGYQHRTNLFPCTLAAFDASKVSVLIDKIKNLKEKIDELGNRYFDTLDKTIKRTVQSFDTFDTYDIKDMAIKLRRKSSNKEIKKTCMEIENAFDGACINNTNLGEDVVNAHGLAIWFPRNYYQLKTTGLTYKKLEFEKLVSWCAFIEKYY